MQVWNVLSAARWKYSTQKIAKSRHLDTIAPLRRAISLQLRHVSTIGKKLLSSNTSTCHNMVNWDPLASLGHPCKFQRVSRLGSVTARHSNIVRQPNTAALNRGLHLYSAGRPSRWALAHILVLLSWVTVWLHVMMKLWELLCGCAAWVSVVSDVTDL